MKNRPFFLLSAFSIVCALLAVKAMSNANKKADIQDLEGFRSAILALEFAQSNAEINAVFGRTASNTTESAFKTIQSKARYLEQSTNWDFLFILAYGSFMFFFALLCRRIGEKRYWLAIVFALLAVLSDTMENGLLKEIFGLVASASTDFSMFFGRLHFWTCLKFFSTGAYFLALGPFFWKVHWLGKLAVLAAAASIVFWALAGFWSAEYWADALFGMILLAFSAAMIFGLVFKSKLTGV